MYLAAITILR